MRDHQTWTAENHFQPLWNTNDGFRKFFRCRTVTMKALTMFIPVLTLSLLVECRFKKDEGKSKLNRRRSMRGENRHFSLSKNV